MGGDDIEWLGEPATPPPVERPPARSRRRSLVGAGVVAAAAVVTGIVIVSGGGSPSPTPSPTSSPTTLRADPSLPLKSELPTPIPDPSPGLVRAVRTYFPGATLSTISLGTGDARDSQPEYVFALRGLLIHVEVGRPASPAIDTRDANQLIANGSESRVLVNSPNRALTGRDYDAAKRLARDKRVGA